MSMEPWDVCRECNERLWTVEGAAVHYQMHISQHLAVMAEAQTAQLALIRDIATSAFLNPRRPGETPLQREQRVRGDA